MAEPIIDHYEINVAAKPRGSSDNAPYTHTANIVLPRGLSEHDAMREYEKWSFRMNVTDPVYIFKCTMYAVHVHSSRKVAP